MGFGTVRNIEISVEEYKKLLDASGAVRRFGSYVRAQKYAIDREMCAILLGFDLDDGRKDDDANTQKDGCDV